MQPKPKLPAFIDPKSKELDKRGPLEEPVKIRITPDQEQTASEKKRDKTASARKTQKPQSQKID